MSKKNVVALILFGVLAFIIPIEHKYDKLFRFYSLTLIPEGLEISKEYDKKIYFFISDLIALVLTMIGLFWFRIPLKKWFGNTLWIVWFCALASIIASPFCHYPIPYIRLLQLFTPIALFSFIANMDEPSKITRIVLTSLVFAGLFQTAIAIAQYFNQAPLGLRLFGETNQTSIFHIADGSRWFIDQLFGRKVDSVIVMRAAGTFPHANVFGGFMVFSILATYFLASQSKKWLYTLPFQFFAMALSYSRAALFAWGIATFFWFCFTRRDRPELISERSRRTLPVIAVMIFTFCGTAFLLYEQYLHRGGVLNYNHWVKSSDNVRKVQQETGVQIVQDHSFFGVGYTQFSERAAPYFVEDIPNYIRVTAPHNIFLFLACETGLISLAAFLLFLANCFWKFLRSPITPESALFFSLLLAFLFIGLCDFYPILFQQGKLMFFLIASLLVLNTKKCEHQNMKYGKKDAIMNDPSRENVWKMFDAISPTYDRTNRIISFGMDQRWRAKVASFLPPQKNLKVLDLATGTGDQALALIKSQSSIQSITGIDLSKEMLEIARRKIPCKMQFLVADAEKLPFKDRSFDAATFSFGIRNVSDPLKALNEIYRVLKPKGRCLILEFSLPPQPIRPFFLFYLRHVLPIVAGLISKNRSAYQYLNRTIEHFPSGKAFCQLMKEADFGRLKEVPMNLGSVTLYIGEK